MSRLDLSPDADSLARTVAERLLARLAELQRGGRIPSVALTGGTIADAIYAAVAAADSSPVDWQRVDFWWGDERYVPAGSSERNDAAARTALLDVVGADPARVHPMPASDESHADLDAAAASYADQLRSSGTASFDLLLLGLGPDGHVASLFPGFAQLGVSDRDAVGVTGSPKPPPQRISLTFAALNRAAEVWFLVSGEGKADAVARSLAPEGSVEQTPARGITVENATWYVDQAAASKL